MGTRLSRLVPAELALTIGFVVFTLAVSVAWRLPVVLPGAQSAAFVGVHYLYPLAAIFVWALVVVVVRRQALSLTFLLAFPCYAVVLLAHFNLKLWVPHVNPSLWDASYWAIDQSLYPLIEGAKWLRVAIAPVVPLDSNLYMLGFIALFYLSFCHHSLRDPKEFRLLVLAVLIMQIGGSLTYFVAPALGPFVVDPGVELPASSAQAHMLELWRANLAGGAPWLAENGGRNMTAGLAAMPSLHAGGSLLFVLFALRYSRKLLWIMAPLFTFITIDALANRWHYLLDIPFGWGIASFAFAAAHALARRAGDHAPMVDPFPIAPGRQVAEERPA